MSGGCKNGKSFYAQRLAKMQQTTQLYYVATMRSVDGEDDDRIARHKLEREGWGFITVEQPAQIENLLANCDSNGSFLIDSATALLANEMFPPDGSIDMSADERIIKGLSQVISEIKDIVIVSDYIYSDAMIYDPITEQYRKSLAAIDRATARLCDAVIEIAYSGVIVHRAPQGLQWSQIDKDLP